MVYTGKLLASSQFNVIYLILQKIKLDWSQMRIYGTTHTCGVNFFCPNISAVSCHILNNEGILRAVVFEEHFYSNFPLKLTNKCRECSQTHFSSASLPELILLFKGNVMIRSPANPSAVYLEDTSTLPGNIMSSFRVWVISEDVR